VNKEIVALINRAGGNAIGLCGKDGNLLHAVGMKSKDGTDLGHVGHIESVHYQVVSVLANEGMIPVIAPIATDPKGGTWNVNADTAAGEIAGALQAEKLVFMTDTPGLLKEHDDPSSLIHQINYRQIRELRSKGIIAGGMIPKVEACLRALDQGVAKTHIINGTIPHALLLEIFTDQGLGTLVTH
jgi:acetylglutamate kinase